MTIHLREGDWFAAGWCAHCAAPFVAIQRQRQSADRFCSGACTKRFSAKTTRQRRRTRAMSGRDLPGLHDLASWWRVRCRQCPKLVFPTLERAMFHAFQASVSLGVLTAPYFEHGRWHLTTDRRAQVRARKQAHERGLLARAG